MHSASCVSTDARGLLCFAQDELIQRLLSSDAGKQAAQAHLSGSGGAEGGDSAATAAAPTTTPQAPTAGEQGATEPPAQAPLAPAPVPGAPGAGVDVAATSTDATASSTANADGSKAEAKPAEPELTLEERAARKEAEEAKRAERARRFGIAAPAASADGAASPAGAAADGKDGDDDEKRRKRAERFGVAAAQEPEKPAGKDAVDKVGAHVGPLSMNVVLNGSRCTSQSLDALDRPLGEGRQRGSRGTKRGGAAAATGEAKSAPATTTTKAKPAPTDPEAQAKLAAEEEKRRKRAERFGAPAGQVSRHAVSLSAHERQLTSRTLALPAGREEGKGGCLTRSICNGNGVSGDVERSELHGHHHHEHVAISAHVYASV